MEPPVESYHGSEPYAYVSYSHKDKEIVYPIIQELARNGIRIWYDEGIIPTNEWQSVIADALQKSSICLCFLSRNAVESRFVGNEINFVISHNIKILPIYLEKFVMPAQYELLLGNIQGLIKHVFEDKIFFEKLLGFLNPLLNPKMEEEPIKIAKKQKSAEEKEKGIIAFISYSHKDGELFQIPEIAEKLKKLPGISEVLYSEKNVVDDFVEYMNKMLGAADIMLLFCSANSRESKFVNREWQAAYANDVPILPVFLEKKEIPFLLRSIDGVLFKPFNTDITVQSIHATIFKKLRKQSPKPVATPQVVLSETEMLDKLNTLLAMAQEIYIDDIANALGITRAEFFNKLALWGKKSRIPFKINKDVILPS
nr:toll/interleukin-1 receptor domain-containing protein [Candidatus Sigynarchaeota archaeon]